MMETAVLNLIWLFLYGYCIEGMGTIQKGRGRRIVAGLISFFFWRFRFGFRSGQSGFWRG